jgi:leucyl-tRNA synthetase
MTTLKKKASIHMQAWPVYDAKLLVRAAIEIPVQINGKVRGVVLVSPDAKEDDVMFAARQETGIARYIEGANIRKIIYIPGRMLNLVVSE